MQNATQVIEQLSGVHEAIRHYVTEIKDDIISLEALSHQCTGEWSDGQCQFISEKQFDLKQNLQYLEKGLHDHYLKESELLKPLAGEFLMKAINKECHEINKQFEQAKSSISDISRGLPTAKDLTAKTSEARQTLEAFSQLVKDHSRKMDVILKMLRSVI